MKQFLVPTTTKFGSLTFWGVWPEHGRFGSFLGSPSECEWWYQTTYLAQGVISYESLRLDIQSLTFYTQRQTFLEKGFTASTSRIKGVFLTVCDSHAWNEHAGKVAKLFSLSPLTWALRSPDSASCCRSDPLPQEFYEKEETEHLDKEVVLIIYF